jgi:hypothetical protein
MTSAAVSLSVIEFAALVGEFLEALVHNILYVRAIYSEGMCDVHVHVDGGRVLMAQQQQQRQQQHTPALFLRARLYGIPVRMSRHPELNQYIRDSIDSALEWMAQVGISVCSTTNTNQTFGGRGRRLMHMNRAGHA